MFNLQSLSNSSKNLNEEPLLELLGIQIYFDDILLLCILIFLFEENINDPMLFIALFLLLICP